VKIRFALGADAVLFIGRDVWDVENAKGRIEPETARRGLTALVASMATTAIGRSEKIFSAFDRSVIGCTGRR
jgi:hypothetical protein